MADVDPTTPCVTCAHPASLHADTDGGDNSGACDGEGCTCPAMVTGQGDPAANSTDGEALTAILTMAADAPSGGAPSGAAPADATSVAISVDAALDTASTTISAIDQTTLTADELAFVGLVNAAGISIDALLDAIGAPDDDDDSGLSATDEGFVSNDEPNGDAVALANAVAASVNAAVALVGSVKNDALQPVVTSLTTLAGQMKDLQDSVAPAPDADPREAPAADTADPAAASNTGKSFADGDTPAADAPAAPADVDGADAPPTDVEDPSMAFTMPVMVLEGVDTGDGRYISENALSWRELPLSVMALDASSHGGFTDPVAKLVGRLDTIQRIDASSLINAKTGEPYGPGVQALKATGVFADVATAADVIALVEGKFLRGVSVDVGDVVSELQVLDDDGNVVPMDPDDEEAIWEAMFLGADVRENVTSGRVMGVTICPFPAFEGAYIEMAGGVATEPSTPAVAAGGAPEKRYPSIRSHDVFGSRPCKPCEDGMPLLASAGPMEPPKAWFQDPQLQGPTPLTITDDGRVYGHLAAWGTCHTAITGRCTTAPHSANDYANFHTGALKTSDGDVISVGHITMGTGHAGMDLSAGPAASHYDNTGTAVVDMCVGEDAYGIWVAGATRPDVTEMQLRTLRSSALSGDWRQIGRGLELVAALAVNVPGFPLPRARVASGATMSLTAAGGRTLLQEALGTGNAELAHLKAWQATYGPVIEKVLADRADTAREKFLSTRAEAARTRMHANV